MNHSIFKKALKLLTLYSLVTCFHPIHSQSTKTVLDSYFAAIGGKEKALQVQTFFSLAKGNFNNKEINFLIQSKLPNKFHSVMKSDSKIISEKTFNGKTGSKLQQGTLTNFKPDEIKKYKKNRCIFPEFNYYKNGKYLGTQTIDGNLAHIIAVENYQVFFDVSTGLKIKGIILTESETTPLKELFYSKYISIEGLLFPSKLTIVVLDKKIELQSVTIAINRDVSDQDFY